MNVNMLKFLVDACVEEVDCVDVDVFFSKYSNDASTISDLKTLSHLGYLSLFMPGGEVDYIGVNKKAFDYFR